MTKTYFFIIVISVLTPLLVLAQSAENFMLTLDLGPELHFDPDEDIGLRYELFGGYRTCNFLIAVGAGRATPGTITLQQLKNLSPETTLEQLVNTQGSFNGTVVLGLVFPFEGGESTIPVFQQRHTPHASIYCGRSGIVFMGEFSTYSLIDSVDSNNHKHRSFHDEWAGYLGAFIHAKKWLFTPFIGVGSNLRLDNVFQSKPARARLRFDFFTPFLKRKIPLRAFFMVQREWLFDTAARKISLPDGTTIERKPLPELVLRLGIVFDVSAYWKKEEE